MSSVATLVSGIAYYSLMGSLVGERPSHALTTPSLPQDKRIGDTDPAKLDAERRHVTAPSCPAKVRTLSSRDLSNTWIALSGEDADNA